MLINCVKPTPDSLFGDIQELDSRKAVEIAADREKWKSSGLLSVADLFIGKCSKKKGKKTQFKNKKNDPPTSFLAKNNQI